MYKNTIRKLRRRRRNTIRAKWYNYKEGSYFVTICTDHHKNHYFGEIKNKRMILSQIGKIAHENWKNIPKYCKNVSIGAFVIMPNHIHGIINIKTTNETQTSPPYKNSPNPRKFGPQSKTLGTIIRGFKSSVTKYAKINNIEFKWQGGYYDKIIQNSKAYNNYSRYIKNNIKNW